MDSRHVYDDPAWIDWYREDLHRVYENGPVPTLVSLPRDFGAGPLAIHTNLLSEQHVFKGQAGGKGVFPLWLPADGQPDDGRRIVAGRRCGLTDDVIDWALRVFVGSGEPAQAAYDYILAILSAPSYAERYWPELEALSPRVPLVEDSNLALEAARLGAQLRDAWDKKLPTTGLKWGGAGHGPLGTVTMDAGVLTFENGRTITGVPHGAWSYSVSHYRVLPEWFAARTHWTATIAQAEEALRTIASVGALVDLGASLDALIDKVVGPGATPLVSQPATAARRHGAVGAEVDLIRITDGPIGLPNPDVSIDLDCESKDGVVYMWGVTMTGTDGASKYQAFVDWTTTTAEKEYKLAAQLADWLTEQIRGVEQTGQTIAVYHYSPTEPANLRRILTGDPRLPDITAYMVDLLAVVRDHYNGTLGKGLKEVAGHFGAKWREEGATGANSVAWAETAQGSGSAAQLARDRLLRYNEDDTRALAVVRRALTK